MKKLFSILLSLAIVLSLSLGAFAQTGTPGVDAREKSQQKRIRRGVKSGSLTRREVARLERQQARTRRIDAKAKSDGKVTRKERARLRHRENKTSRHIYRQKHDRQNRR